MLQELVDHVVPEHVQLRGVTIAKPLLAESVFRFFGMVFAAPADPSAGEAGLRRFAAWERACRRLASGIVTDLLRELRITAVKTTARPGMRKDEPAPTPSAAQGPSESATLQHPRPFSRQSVAVASVPTGPAPLIRSGLDMVAEAVRRVAPGAGFRSRWVATPTGVWHCYERPAAQTATRSRQRAAGAIVVVHGMFTTALSLLPLAQLLSRLLPCRRILLPDLLGFDQGHSRLHPKAEYPGFHGMVSALCELLDHVGERGEVDLLGHSFGGWLCASVALRAPSRVRRLGLLAPAGHGRYRMLRTAGLFASTDGLKRMVGHRVGGGMLATPAVALAEGVLKTPANVRTIFSAGPSYFAAPPKQIQQPTLLLWGTHDDIHAPYYHRTARGGPVSKWESCVMGVDCSEAALRSGRVRESSALLRDFPNGCGAWLAGTGHQFVIDSAGTTAALCAALLSDAGVPASSPDAEADATALRRARQMVEAAREAAVARSLAAQVALRESKDASGLTGLAVTSALTALALLTATPTIPMHPTGVGDVHVRLAAPAAAKVPTLLKSKL